MKLVRYIPFVFLVLFPLLVGGTAVADTNAPEAVESSSNWDTTRKLTNQTNAPNGAQRPIVAVAPNNSTIIVAYLRQNSASELDVDPYYRKSPDGGDTWTQPARIYSSAAISRQVHVALDSKSRGHAVWTEGDNQLWYAGENQWAGNGAQLLFTANVLIELPKIAVDANDTLHIVWSEVKFTGQDIYYSRSFDGGANWTAAEKISSGAASSESPALAIDANNRANVIWEEQVGGTEYKINYSRRSGGVWSTPISISNIVPNLTSAREPDIAIKGGRVMVVFENRVSLPEQTLYYLECTNNCTVNPLTSNQWRYRLVTPQTYGAKDSDPTYLGPKVAAIGQCRTIFFSGIAGNTSTNNEKIRLADSCSGFTYNPLVQTIEDSLGVNDRAIKPSVAVLNNWQVFLAYEQKSPARSDIYFVRNQPGIFLPLVIK